MSMIMCSIIAILLVIASFIRPLFDSRERFEIENLSKKG